MTEGDQQRARLAILISGRGTNMGAIADACKRGSIMGDVALVVSNVPDAPGLARAQERGLKAVALDHRGRKRSEFDAEVTAALQAEGVTLVCLAGYMRLLSKDFVRTWERKILNIHPSLLPAFPGLEAQKQAFQHGVKVAGCTVHFVDEDLDQGPIILQEALALRDGDSLERLSARILDIEHRLYPKAVALVAAGRVTVKGRTVVLS